MKIKKLQHAKIPGSKEYVTNQQLERSNEAANEVTERHRSGDLRQLFKQIPLLNFVLA